MKIIVNRQEALALAKSAESIAPVKTAIEELRCVLLEASPDNLLTMAATNIETALERRMPAEVQESGSILLNAKLLSNMLGLLGGETVTICGEDGGQVEISSEDCQYVIPTMPVSD